MTSPDKAYIGDFTLNPWSVSMGSTLLMTALYGEWNGYQIPALPTCFDISVGAYTVLFAFAIYALYVSVISAVASHQ